MPDITSNLELHWKFDDGSGTSATDSSGNGHTGTLNNTPTWIAGHVGTNAISFAAASNENVTRAGFTMPTTGSVSLWIKPTRAFNAGVIERVFQTYDNAARAFDIQHTNTSTLLAGWFVGTDDRITVALDAAKWDTTAWQHFVVTWASGGATNIYRNTVSLGSEASTNSTTAGVSDVAVASQTSNTTYYDGSVDDVRIYSRVLAAEDIAELFEPTTASGAELASNRVNSLSLGLTI